MHDINHPPLASETSSFIPPNSTSNSNTNTFDNHSSYKTTQNALPRHRPHPPRQLQCCARTPRPERCPDLLRCGMLSSFPPCSLPRPFTIYYILYAPEVMMYTDLDSSARSNASTELSPSTKAMMSFIPAVFL